LPSFAAGAAVESSRTVVAIHSAGGFTGMTVADGSGMIRRAEEELRRMGEEAGTPIVGPPRSKAVGARDASEWKRRVSAG
jgi:hypothetical protein